MRTRDSSTRLGGQAIVEQRIAEQPIGGQPIGHQPIGGGPSVDRACTGPGAARFEGQAGLRALVAWCSDRLQSDDDMSSRARGWAHAIFIVPSSEALPVPDADAPTEMRRQWPADVPGMHRLELQGRRSVSEAGAQRAVSGATGAPGTSDQSRAPRTRILISVLIRLRPRVLKETLRMLERSAEPRCDGPVHVVGAGLAGCALVATLRRRGRPVVLHDALDTIGGVVRELPLIAQHPAHSVDDDPRSRLSRAAMLLIRRFDEAYGGGDGGVDGDVDRGVWHANGRWQRDGHGRWQHLPLADSVDPRRWCAKLVGADDPLVELRLGARVDSLDDPAFAERCVVLANQRDAFRLLHLDRSVQGRNWHEPHSVAVGYARSSNSASNCASNFAATRAPNPVRGGDGYLIEWPGRVAVASAPGAAAGDASPPIESASEAARRAMRALGQPDTSDAYEWHWSRPQQRLSLRDHLPMIGAAPDPGPVLADPGPWRRDAARPIPVQRDRWLLCGLGGRGLLWSVLGAEIIAGALCGEPAPIESDLLRAVAPDRFLRRALARGQFPL